MAILSKDAKQRIIISLTSDPVGREVIKAIEENGGVLSGNGAPDNSLGENGNLYVDLLTGDFYVKHSNSWELQAGGGGGVVSVNGETGIVVLDKADIGLDQVDNTSDLDKPISDDTQDALDTKQDTSEKNQPDGYVGLNGSSKIDSIYLPSYVDDILEFANLAAFPVTGSTGILYLALDTDKIYRWSGSTYVEVSQGITDHTLLDNIGTNTHANIDTHIASTSNPHSVTAAQVGLGNVDNTSDLDKPISNDTQDALDLKYDASNPAGYITLAEVPASPVTSVNTYTGDVVLTKTDINLGNVDNTSDLDKPISNDTQDALDLITNVNWTGDYNNGVTYTVGQGVMYNGASFRMIAAIGAAGYPPVAYPGSWLQVTDYVSPNDIGLGNVDNTSDLDKPISNDTQDALDLKVDKAGDIMTGPLNMQGGTENIEFSVYGLTSTSTIEIKSDNQVTVPSGDVKLTTGNASGTDYAGSVYLQGGSNVDGNPANIQITAGQSSGIGANGSIILDSKNVVYLNQNALGSIQASNHRIEYVLDPIENQDAATKIWVEGLSSITNTIIVDASSTTPYPDGSIFKPFPTIAEAITVATNDTVLIVLPGLYEETKISIPSTLKNLVILGQSRDNTIIKNGVEYIAPADDITVLFEKIDIGQFTLDANYALNGIVSIKQSSVIFDRIDNNFSVVMSVTESNIVGGSIAGGPTNINECLILSSPTIFRGLLIVENTKFVQDIAVSGPELVTIRTLDCELFGAPRFISGNSNTIWETDLATDYLGASSSVTKVLLANVPLSNITQSGASVGEVPSWDGSAWVPSTVSSLIPTVTADRALISDSSGQVAASSVTSTTLSYLDVTSSAQTQLDTKIDNEQSIINALIFG